MNIWSGYSLTWKNAITIILSSMSCHKPLFQSEAYCEAIYMKMISYSHANGTHFHNKGFALSLVVKVMVFKNSEMLDGFLCPCEA